MRVQGEKVKGEGHRSVTDPNKLYTSRRHDNFRTLVDVRAELVSMS